MRVKETGTATAAAQGRPAGQPFKKLLDDAQGRGPQAGRPGQAPAPGARAQGAAALGGRGATGAAAAGAASATGTAAQAAGAAAALKQVHQAADQAQGARARVSAEAERLVAVRTDHAVVAQQAAQARGEPTDAARPRLDERVLELICRDLMSDGDARGTRAANAEQGAGRLAPPVPGAGPSDRGDVKARGEQAVALVEKIEVLVKSQRPALSLTLNNSLGARVEIERLGPREVAVKLVGHKGPPSPDTVGRLRDELRARGLKVGALSVG